MEIRNPILMNRTNVESGETRVRLTQDERAGGGCDGRHPADRNGEPAAGLVMKGIDSRLKGTRKFRAANPFPFVTVSYAQSLDGSIAAIPGHPLALSGIESVTLTHRLRTLHDAILVGIGTVLSDDPRLNVRLVEGIDPQPVILDGRLRFPLNARLLANSRCLPWIVTKETIEPERGKELRKRGVRVISCASDGNGQIDLSAVLATLKSLGIHSLLVEGGARVITSFLSARLVDQIVVTIAPCLIGGLRAPEAASGINGSCYPRLLNVCYESIGQDLVLRGDPWWGTLP